jgi:small subunit ribosomal protein S6
LNQYEIAILYHPDLEIDLDKASKRVEKIFTDNGGKVIKADNWGKRKLAYPIKRNEHAIYVFYTLEFPAANLQKVESTLNITDEVIRFLITKPDFKAISKAETEKAKLLAKQSGDSDNEPSDSSEDSEE